MEKITPWVNKFNNLLLDTEKNGTMHEAVLHVLTSYLQSSYCNNKGYSHIKGKVSRYKITYKHSCDVTVSNWPFPHHKGDAKRQYIYAYVEENGIINEYHLSAKNIKKYLRRVGKYMSVMQ